MTDDDAIRLYVRAWPHDAEAADPEDNRRDAIADEVRQMIAAPTDDAAYRIVEWWIRSPALFCGGQVMAADEKQLRADVRRLRKMAARQAWKEVKP